MSTFSINMDDSEVRARLRELANKSHKALVNAEKKAALQFLDWANNGSPNESVKPPIKTGFLRGSASAFVGSVLVGVFENGNTTGAARSNSSPEFDVTWNWNASYATKMHENEDWEPGEASQRDGDVGPHWATKHLEADKAALMQMITLEFGKEVGTL